MKPIKLINVGEKNLELNYGQFHYDLKPGEVTPPLGNEMANSFCVRCPDLRVYNEEEGMLETPNLETFPGHQDPVDAPDRDEAETPSEAQDETSGEDEAQGQGGLENYNEDGTPKRRGGKKKKA